MVNCKFTNHVNGVYAKSDNHFGNHLVFNGRVIEGYDQSVVQSVTDWLITQESIAIDNFNYLIENGDEDAFTWLYILMLRTQLAELQVDSQDGYSVDILATKQHPAFIEMNLRFDAGLNRLCLIDPDMVTNYNTSLVDGDTIEKLKQLSVIGRFRIPNDEYKINEIRTSIFSKGIIQFLFDCYEKANERKGLVVVGDEPMNVQTLSLLHFRLRYNTLIISEQPLDSKQNHIRYINRVSIADSDIAQWCEDNSPLYIPNTDAMMLMNTIEWSDDYCLSFLRDLQKNYKKPISFDEGRSTIITPKPRYRMTFYYSGIPRTFIRNEPCYFARYDAEAESFDAIIGTPYEPVALPTNGDKYVILSPCTVDELAPLWTICPSHHDYDYNLEYDDGISNYKMGINNRDNSHELVNWFLDHQPELNKEQLDSIFSAKWDSGLKLFKVMYK